MKKYIVGGAVRDRLLGINPKDRDWVIVGADAKDVEYLKSIGYTLIGKDFPVFLSPAGEEVALARIERKNGNGYNGFECRTEKVTIEEDLYRRDLTINSMAYDPILNMLVDPYGGKSDIDNKILRHTSDAFSEDPLRVLRLARFAARYKDFSIHESTFKLATNMVKKGELKHLSHDRVMMEFHKAFSDKNSHIFIEVLNKFGFIEQFFDKKLKQEELKTIKNISVNATPAYVGDFIFMMLLGVQSFDKNHKLNGVPYKETHTQFNKFYSKFKELLQFKKKTPEEITEWFYFSSIHNKGGEQFIYKCTEYLNLIGEMTLELEEYIIKMYDSYYSVKIPDIKEMVKRGELQNSEIKNFVYNLHLFEIKKRF